MKERPIIAYVAGTYPLVSETFVRREVDGLKGRGWDVRTVSLRGGNANTTVYSGVLSGAMREMARHPMRSMRTMGLAIGDAAFPGEKMRGRLKILGQALAGIKLAGELRGVGHVHAHFAHAPATVAMYAARHLGVSFSFTGHANDLFQRRALLKRKLQRAKFVACISQWHRDFYEKIWSGGPYDVIRCGVDVKSWAPSESRGADGPMRILTVCRLVEKKGVDTLLMATKEMENVAVTVAGDGPMRPRLKAIGNKNVTWLGVVENERVRALLMETDLFVLPCRDDASGDRDGIPVVLMEAMACGVPVISGDLPAIRELVEDGVSGMLVKDVAELRERIEKLRDTELRRKLADGGRAAVEKEFSLEMNLDRLERRYE